jgi:ech hydrogenase subunit D
MSTSSFEDIAAGELPSRSAGMKSEGFRLAQICCTKLPETLELLYSFDKNFELRNFRVVLPNASEAIPSISSVYWNAFLYENEIHDLFGIQIHGIALDYQGKFYRTQVKAPFNPAAAVGAGEKS